MRTEWIKWIVRPTTCEDEDSVNALLKVSYETLLPEDYEQDVMEKNLPLMTTARPELLTSGTWYVVEHPEDRTVVGCGGWAHSSPTWFPGDKENPHLRHFATHPEFTRQGVGKAIWIRIWKDIVAEMGCNPELEVYATFTGQPFYASLGFEFIENVQLAIHPNCMFPCVLMRRAALPYET